MSQRKQDQSAASGKPRRGRPKGSKNKPAAATVETVKVQCKKCQSSDTEWVSRTRKDMVISGVHEGQPYTSIRWNRRKCRNCGQVFMHQQYINS